MKLSARLLAAMAVLFTVAGASAQDNYPSKSIELVVPFTPGGAIDTHGRIVAEQLSKQLGVPVVVVNKPGANGNIAAEVVSQARPDGYTLLYNSSSLTLSAALYKSLNFDIFRDFTPISMTGAGVMSIVVSPQKHPDIKSLGEFVAALKKPDARIAYASGGVGNISHLAAVLFLDGIGVKSAVHVPFPGGTEAITSVMSGETDFTVQSVSATRGLIQDGKLRAVAVTTSERSPILPDVPTVAEGAIPGFEVSSWHGIVAPAGLPDAIRDRLNREVVAAMKEPSVRKKFEANATQPRTMSSAEFGTYIADEVKRWEVVMRAGGIEKQ